MNVIYGDEVRTWCRAYLNTIISQDWNKVVLFNKDIQFLSRDDIKPDIEFPLFVLPSLIQRPRTRTQRALIMETPYALVSGFQQ